MDELRLVGVHDDGEHLVLQDASGARFVLHIDQHLRGTVARARRMAPRRQGFGSGDFGPRDIQARFRAGATVEEIVEESGWEAGRVRRYEWPILAERAHMAREAQKVEVVARTSRSGGYRSVFDGEAQSLAQIVATHASELGIAVSSLDWDAWQRPDQQWEVTARFRVADPDTAPRDLVDQQPAAQWVFNPAALTVTPDNGWASRLTATPGADNPFGSQDGPFGTTQTTTRSTATDSPTDSFASDSSASDSSATDSSVTDSSATEESTPSTAGEGTRADAESSSEPTRQEAESGTASDEPTQTVADSTASPSTTASSSSAPDTRNTDELLEVLGSRRGQRLGQDAASDDQLAEILGRNMGHVDRHPRPISAPQDSTLFDRPVNPAHPSLGASATVSTAPTQDDAEKSTTAKTDGETDRRTDSGTADTTVEPDGEAGTTEATIHHLGRADIQERPESPVLEITDTDSRPMETDDAEAPSTTPAPAVRGSESATNGEESAAQDSAASSPAEVREATVTPLRGNRIGDSPQEESEDESEDPEADQPSRPRPRGRTGSKRSRSSVPSWDEIVFGAKNDDH